MTTSPRISKHNIQSNRYKTIDKSLSFWQHDKDLSPWEQYQLLQDSFNSISFKNKSNPQHKHHRLNYNTQNRIFHQNIHQNKNKKQILEKQKKENIIKTNFISMSLGKQPLEAQHRLRWGSRQQNEPTNRIKKLKNKLKINDRNQEKQQEEIYNKTIQMFSTCLTQRFSKDLAEQSLVIYPAIPQKIAKNKKRTVELVDDKKKVLPQLLNSRQGREGLGDWRVKGQDIKSRIRHLLFQEKERNQ